MKNLVFACLLSSLLLLTVLPAAAEEPESGSGRGRHGSRWADDAGPPPPFGDYCPRRHADHYGARQPLRTPEEAKGLLAQFFKRPPSQILLRRELRMGYIADVTNPDGSLFDRVIIDMRSGRIRSIR